LWAKGHISWRQTAKDALDAFENGIWVQTEMSFSRCKLGKAMLFQKAENRMAHKLLITQSAASGIQAFQ